MRVVHSLIVACVAAVVVGGCVGGHEPTVVVDNQAPYPWVARVTGVNNDGQSDTQDVMVEPSARVTLVGRDGLDMESLISVELLTVECVPIALVDMSEVNTPSGGELVLEPSRLFQVKAGTDPQSGEPAALTVVCK